MITIQVEKLSIIQSDFISQHIRACLSHSCLFVRSLERSLAQQFDGIELDKSFCVARMLIAP